MTLLQHHVLALSLTALTTLGLGLLVFLADSKRPLNRVFGLYSISIAWWGFTECFLTTSTNTLVAEFWNDWEWIGASFIAPTFLHTIFLVTEERDKKQWAILFFGYVAGAVFSVLNVFFPNTVTQTPRGVAYTNYFGALTQTGYYLPGVFLVLVNIGLVKLWCAYRTFIGQKRTQLKFLFWGSLIGYLGGSPDWAFAFGFYIPVLNPFGIYGIPFYSIATTYAVLHHRLFDVNLVIRKSLVYSILVSSLTIGYFGLVYAVERLFQMTFGYHSVWLSLAAFALMALAFQPLKIGIQRMVDWLLFRAPHEELVRRMERFEQETRQTEKLKAVATLAAGMAHEIKNPLSSIKTFAEYLPEKYDDPSFREKFARIISQEVGKINDLVQRLLDFAKPSQPQKQPVRLSNLIDETVEFLQGTLLSKHIEVVRAYTRDDEVSVDPAQMKQAFLNVLLNSIEAMDHQGCITITTVLENEHLEVIVADTGPGIPKKELPHVFDPFYTTKLTGTGLGLSVVHSIVQEHGGRVAIDSDTGRGTTVRIQLPIPETRDKRHETRD